MYFDNKAFNFKGNKIMRYISLFIALLMVILNTSGLLEMRLLRLKSKLDQLHIHLEKIIKKSINPLLEQKKTDCFFKRLTTVKYEDLRASYDKIKMFVVVPLIRGEFGEFTNELNKELNDDFGMMYTSGYVFVSSEELMKAKKSSSKKTAKNLRKKKFNNLVQNYKIHLMPKDACSFMVIIEQFLKELKNNSTLQNAVNGFKFKFVDFATIREKITDNLRNDIPISPIMVIYPGKTKENAQMVLNTVYRLFGSIEGLDVIPRGNKKITSLIYYAQGDWDFKIYPEYEGYFTSDKIFFRPDIENKGYNVDYSLNDPSKTID